MMVKFLPVLLVVIERNFVGDVIDEKLNCTFARLRGVYLFESKLTSINFLSCYFEEMQLKTKIFTILEKRKFSSGVSSEFKS